MNVLHNIIISKNIYSDALFDSILENLEPPLIVSNTQGDAIISYAPEQAFLHAQPLLDIMEKTYFAFRRQLELMDLNTTCDCNACINMNALDLKIFLHYGQYLLQDIGDKTDLQGSDVILVHRLMKNTVTEKTGWAGYGLLTAAAIQAMDIEGITEGMIEHVENYEHLGQVKLYIHDLRQAWKIAARTKSLICIGRRCSGRFQRLPSSSTLDRLGLCLRYGSLKQRFFRFREHRTHR